MFQKIPERNYRQSKEPQHKFKFILLLIISLIIKK